MKLIDPKRLKQLRTQHHLTRDNLSERSSVSQRHIARIEASKAPYRVRLKTAERLARALGVRAEELAGDEAPAKRDDQRSQSRSQSHRAIRKRAPKATHIEFDQLKLKALRTWSGLSRRELAREAGVSERQIARIESSTSYARVHMETVERLANALNTDVNSLLDKAPLSGLPADAMAAGRGGLKKALPKVQLSARVSHHVRLAYDLVQRRYGPSARELMVLAPLLFVLLAEGSLAWRRERLEAVEEAMDQLQAFGAEPHLYFTPYISTVEEGFFAEKDSIENRDVSGETIRGDTYLHQYGGDDVNPFADYLKKLVEDTGVAKLVDFESGDRIVPDPYWGTEPPRLFQGWLEEIAGGSDHARWALEYGDVRLSSIPRELRAKSAKKERVAWLESQLSDETKKLMDRSKSLGARESALVLEAFDSDSVAEYRRQLVNFYFELFSAGRGRANRKSS